LTADHEPDAGQELEDLETVFRGLNHATRRHILLVLHFRGGEMTAGEIASRFACTWPTTTRHLGILKEAGLVEVIKHGRERIYRVSHDRLRLLSDWLGWFARPALVPPRSSKGSKDG
jgi:DNA-binding transcriptional ArsR family regulator